MKFKIENKTTGTSRVLAYQNNYHTMYEYLLNHYNIDEETAIEIDSWSELATIDEQYETDELIITCVD